MANHEWSEGRSIGGLKGVAGSVTDCSDWESDIPEAMWSEGRSVSGAKGVPGSVTDCAGWEVKSPVWLVVKLRYPTGMSAEVVAEHAHRIVEALKAIDPGLGLQYDRERTIMVDGQVAVAVSPTVFPVELEERLARLIAPGRQIDATVPVVGISLEWEHPLAV